MVGSRGRNSVVHIILDGNPAVVNVSQDSVSRGLNSVARPPRAILKKFD